MEFKCKICNKNYKSYQSLWIHNHKYHYDNNPQISSIITQKTSINPKIPHQYNFN